MRRAAVGRDAGLTVRILVVFTLLGVSLAVTGAAIAWLFYFLPTWWPAWIAVAAGVTVSVAFQYSRAEESLLDVADAAIVNAETEPHLCNLVDRVAAMLDLPAPKAALSHASLPNGFATALTKRRAVVTITDEMRRHLDEHELEAVIAHELAHIANRDAVVMTVASVPRTLGRQLFAAEDTWSVLWCFLWPLGLALYAWSSFLTLALSRYREYSADSVSALATGRPESLMSALEKLSDEIAGIPDQDLRTVASLNQLFIVPVRGQERRHALLRDHPPLDKRLSHLASIARRLGKPGH
jgi:heat shock protein HtpX